VAGEERPARRPAKRWSAVERTLRQLHGPLIAGVDEVGRGPLAGPVVACAVIMPSHARTITGVDDSKLLTAPRRARLADQIRKRALAIGVGAASVREIERLNIYQATAVAMRRALRHLGVVPDHIIVDGRPMRSLAVQHTAVVRGDSRCYSVACASIVAKVTRDRVMKALARRYPEYVWDANVGYGTTAHLAGIESRGLSPHHRRTFFHHRQLALELGDEAIAAAASGSFTHLEMAEMAFGDLEVIPCDAMPFDAEGHIEEEVALGGAANPGDAADQPAASPDPSPRRETPAGAPAPSDLQGR
jgi:ribonuclease HII